MHIQRALLGGRGGGGGGGGAGGGEGGGSIVGLDRSLAVTLFYQHAEPLSILSHD